MNRAEQSNAFDRNAHIPPDVLAERVFRLRPFARFARPFWTCPKCNGTDTRGRATGRRPRHEHTCWRCGWSHYDNGPPFVAVVDLDTLSLE